ncbi:MAG: PEP-CTERM sorting domain-containing protein [Pirellulaceae bacterium]|nr:PEP-CTERM sorting domain-containing protein [Planctomycetales bacterium]
MTDDFGTEFSEVSSATLHVEGEAWNGNGPGRFKSKTQLTFIVDLEGQESRFSHEITKRETRKSIGRYSEDFPLLFDDSVLDGTGPISLTVYTFGKIDHMSSSVTSASLVFDGVTLDLPVAFTAAVPEPTTLFLAALGAMPLGRFARRFRK